MEQCNKITSTSLPCLDPRVSCGGWWMLQRRRLAHPTRLLIGASFQRPRPINRRTLFPVAARLYLNPASPGGSPQWSLSLIFLSFIIYLTTMAGGDATWGRWRMWARKQPTEGAGEGQTGHFRVRDRLFLTFLAHVTTRPRESRAFVVSGAHPTVSRECTYTDTRPGGRRSTTLVGLDVRTRRR